MSIDYAILGYISWQPMSGYDLKKIFMRSITLPWSGNNNQIYRALSQLHEQGWVEKEVEQQENLPPRKIYTITDSGRQALREWVKSDPQAPSQKHAFLIQLLWADMLNADELDNLLEHYAEDVRHQMALCQEELRQMDRQGPRSQREEFLWKSVQGNWILYYKNELDWLEKIRSGLRTFEN